MQQSGVQGLPRKEMELLSRSWRLIFKEKRKSWKIAAQFWKELEKQDSWVSAVPEKAATSYRVKLEMVIKEMCNNVTDVIRKSPMPTCTTPEIMVIFYEM
jgi:hypothetical protein